MKTILLIGKNGQVGWELQHTLQTVGNVIALDRSKMDLTQPDSIRRTMRDIAPDIIVNAAGYTAVDKAESEPELALQINAVAPGILAEEARKLDALLVHYSTDYVFDGKVSEPYTEADQPNPVNVYGTTKLAGEKAIALSGCMYLVLRASWIYSARGKNFVLSVLEKARQSGNITVVSDQIGSPSWARTLALTTADLLRKRQSGPLGVYHLSAPDAVSRFEFARAIVDEGRAVYGIAAIKANVTPVATASFPLPAQRPLNAATNKDRIRRDYGITMPSWHEQLRAFFEDYRELNISHE